MLEIANYIREGAVRLSMHVIAPSVRARVLNAVLGIVHFVTHDPRIHLLISGGEYAVALVWEQTVLNIGRERMGQLLTVGDSQLNAIRSLTSLYRQSIDERATLRRLRETEY